MLTYMNNPSEQPTIRRFAIGGHFPWPLIRYDFKSICLGYVMPSNGYREEFNASILSNQVS